MIAQIIRDTKRLEQIGRQLAADVWRRGWNGRKKGEALSPYASKAYKAGWLASDRADAAMRKAGVR